MSLEFPLYMPSTPPHYLHNPSPSLSIEMNNFVPLLYPSSYREAAEPKIDLNSPVDENDEIWKSLNPPREETHEATAQNEGDGFGDLLEFTTHVLSRPNLGAPIEIDDAMAELNAPSRTTPYFTAPASKTKNPEREARIKIGLSAILLSVLSISITLLVLYFLKMNIKQVAGSSIGIEFFTLTGLVGLAGMIECGYSRAHLYK